MLHSTGHVIGLVDVNCHTVHHYVYYTFLCSNDMILKTCLSGQSLLPFLVHLRLFCYDKTISDIAHSLSAFCCQACWLRQSSFRCVGGLLGLRASAYRRLKEEAPPR